MLKVVLHIKVQVHKYICRNMCHGSFGFTTEKTKIISSIVHISTRYSPILKFEKKRKGAVIICILDISESIIW